MYPHRTFLVLLTVVSVAPVAAAQSVQWLRQFGTTGTDFAFGAAADSTGVYVVGNVFNAALPGQTLVGSTDAFIRKYDANGIELWTRQFGTTVGDDARAVAVFDGGIYVVGFAGGVLPG
jgi:hypothetical protein